MVIFHSYVKLPEGNNLPNTRKNHHQLGEQSGGPKKTLILGQDGDPWSTSKKHFWDIRNTSRSAEILFVIFGSNPSIEAVLNINLCTNAMSSWTPGPVKFSLSGCPKLRCFCHQCCHRSTRMRTMVLEYLPTNTGPFWGSVVGKYSSTMVRIWLYKDSLHTDLSAQL